MLGFRGGVWGGVVGPPPHRLEGLVQTDILGTLMLTRSMSLGMMTH